jgi:glycosyltransferase involved in cell wall biosynthesis
MMPTRSLPDFHPAFVVPRYGEQVVGGAEDLARRTAEELTRRSCTVTVLTTQALDHQTWKNHYPPGVASINGVEVIRFPAQTRLGDSSLHRVLEAVASGRPVGEADQLRWLEGVISSPELFEYVRVHGQDYSHLIFLPYLFGTTYFGSAIHPERSYIIPCLHDEPYAHQELIRKMLTGVKGLIFNSPGEKMLASRLLGVDDPGPVVGMGFYPPDGDPSAFRDRTAVRGNFVLYAGRREEGKNTPLLIDHFRKFARQNPGMASLVLMGAGDVSIPPDSSQVIFDLGRVTERQKCDGYAAAAAFCQPSVNESLSIVLLESWLCGVPALVNRDCEVTREHIRAGGGGLTFSSYPEFAEALIMILENSELAKRMGEAGRLYVTREYNWDSVIERLLAALEARQP